MIGQLTEIVNSKSRLLRGTLAVAYRGSVVAPSIVRTAP